MVAERKVYVPVHARDFEAYPSRLVLVSWVGTGLGCSALCLAGLVAWRQGGRSLHKKELTQLCAPPSAVSPRPRRPSIRLHHKKLT